MDVDVTQNSGFFLIIDSAVTESSMLSSCLSQTALDGMLCTSLVEQA